MNRYDVGDVVRMRASFTNSAGTAVDPSSVSFQYRPPIDVTTSLAYDTDAALVKSSTGVYYADINVSSSGVWKYRWNGAGSNAAAAEGVFEVRFRDVF